MNHTHRTLSVAACATAAAFVLAWTAPVQAASANAPDPATLQALSGSYQMADGSVLSVAQRGRRLVASIHDTELTLVPASENTFATPDGSRQLRFHVRANGSVDGLTLQSTRR
jgi:hypothetical protein